MKNNIFFDKNFNGKLNNKIFTTIRKYANYKFMGYSQRKNQNFNLMLKSDQDNYEKVGEAKLLDVFYTNDFLYQCRANPSIRFMALVDTGAKSLEELDQIFNGLNINKFDDVLVLLFERV